MSFVFLGSVVDLFVFRRQARITEEIANIDKLLEAKNGLATYELQVEKSTAKLAILRIQSNLERFISLTQIVVLAITVFGIILSLITRNSEKNQNINQQENHLFYFILSSLVFLLFYSRSSNIQIHHDHQPKSTVEQVKATGSKLDDLLQQKATDAAKLV